MINFGAGGVGGGGGRGGGVGEYGGDCDGAGGLVKLRDDVQMCGYRDVEVMWNMLSISMQPQPLETAARSTNLKLPNRGCKQRSSLWRLFFWISHNP